MSEAEYFNTQAALFRKENKLPDDMQIFIKYSGFSRLYEFLLENPEAEIIHSDIKWKVQERRGMVIINAARTDVKMDTWYGDMEFKWKGKNVHARSLITSTGSYARDTILVACDTFAVFNEIHNGAHQFSINKSRLEYADMIFNSRGKNIKLPGITWDMLCLPEGMADDIKYSAETFFSSSSRYSEFGLAYRRGFLFAGPPGCGKTMAIKAIASTQKVFCSNFIPRQDCRNDLSELEDIFEYAQEMAPSIIILEDLDKFGHSIPISAVLNLLDGLDNPHGILVIATTNEPEKLDPALLLRPSRFDRVWNFPLPAFEERLKFLKKKAGDKVSENILIETAQKANGFSMAYVQEIFATALSIAVRERREFKDADILTSVGILRKQIKNSKKPQDIVGTTEVKLGF